MEHSPRGRRPEPAGRWAARPAQARERSLAQRFRDAGRGIVAAYREEPNLRFHCLAAGAALVLARAVGLTGLPLLYLCGTIALVITAELVNTAVERAVNLAAGDRYHPLAGLAKDAAAGAVLVTALHAAVAAWVLFVGPRGPAGLIHTLAGYWSRRPLEAAFLHGLVAGLGALAAYGRYTSRKRG